MGVSNIGLWPRRHRRAARRPTDNISRERHPPPGKTSRPLTALYNPPRTPNGYLALTRQERTCRRLKGHAGQRVSDSMTQLRQGRRVSETVPRLVHPPPKGRRHRHRTPACLTNNPLRLPQSHEYPLRSAEGDHAGPARHLPPPRRPPTGKLPWQSGGPGQNSSAGGKG